MVPQWFQKNPHFTGRTKLLKTLREKLCDEKPKSFNHRVALFGMGGVGKTQVAIQYIVNYQSEYDGIFWITAADSAALLSGFRDVARITGCTKVDNQKSLSVVREVLAWFRKQDGWLLVLDNADIISVVDGYLPDMTSRGHTLITTRNPNALGIPAEGLEVELLEKHEAKDLLLLRANIIDDNEMIQSEALNIVMELGLLALAIEQAAAYIREQLKDIFKFMVVYSAHRKLILMERPKGNWNYPREVATTWLLSFVEVEKRNIDASQLLKLIAFLNPDGILVDFLVAGKGGLPEGLNRLIGDLFAFSKALSDLEQFSLIRRPDGGQVFTIHRLVQSVIKDNLGDDDMTKYIEIVVALFTCAFPQFKEERRQICRRFEGQVVGPLIDILKMPKEDMAALADISRRVGDFLHEEGKYRETELFHRRAIEIYTRLFGEEDYRTLSGMHAIARMYRYRGQHQDAAELHEKVLKARQRILGVDHPDTLMSMNNLGIAYYDLIRTKEAAELHEKVLEARRRVLGVEHPTTLKSINNLAFAYYSLGRSKEAVEMFEKVREEEERILGIEHPDTLAGINNLAWSYHSLGRTKEAAEMQEKVLEVSRRVLGEDHPDTMMTMHNLAWSYHSMGRTREAVEMQEKVLEVTRRILGEEHPDTLMTMQNLASSYHSIGRTRDAVEIQEKVLEVRRRALGEEHPDTLETMNTLALSYHSLGQTKEAVEMQEKVLGVNRRILGEEH
jgi:tetratricopeptide (TPR) repeat protein